MQYMSQTTRPLRLHLHRGVMPLPCRYHIARRDDGGIQQQHEAADACIHTFSVQYSLSRRTVEQ